MNVNWFESTQLMAEIVELIEIEGGTVPEEAMVRMPTLIHNKSGMKWNQRFQEWVPENTFPKEMKHE